MVLNRWVTVRYVVDQCMVLKHCNGPLCCRPVHGSQALCNGPLCCRPLHGSQALGNGPLCCRPLHGSQALGNGPLCCRPVHGSQLLSDWVESICESSKVYWESQR